LAEYLSGRRRTRRITDCCGVDIGNNKVVVTGRFVAYLNCVLVPNRRNKVQETNTRPKHYYIKVQAQQYHLLIYIFGTVSFLRKLSSLCRTTTRTHFRPHTLDHQSGRPSTKTRKSLDLSANMSPPEYYNSRNHKATLEDLYERFALFTLRTPRDDNEINAPVTMFLPARTMRNAFETLTAPSYAQRENAILDTAAPSTAHIFGQPRPHTAHDNGPLARGSQREPSDANLNTAAPSMSQLFRLPNSHTAQDREPLARDTYGVIRYTREQAERIREHLVEVHTSSADDENVLHPVLGRNYNYGLPRLWDD
jgi:hypothetical protein